MIYRKLGKTNLEVSVVGLGTYQSGAGGYLQPNSDTRG